MRPLAVDWFGDRAVVVRMADPRVRWALVTALGDEFGQNRVRAGMESVLVESTEPDAHLRDRVAQWLAEVVVDSGVAGPSTSTIEIPVVYDGEDLNMAAAALGCDVATLVAAHSAQQWSVAMMGFAPGFGYLVPFGDSLLPWAQVPRLDRPRPRVPRGSVGMAAGMSAVYPAPMPGGWLLLGTTEVTMFDPDNEEEPTLLRPGSQVRFVEADV
jgi:KipI family sensor histidine kinase inhibitor